MYGFHYQYMMEKFHNNKLLFTDTDSFCYSILGVVGLRAKMYSLKLGEGFNKATAKGVGRLVRGEITHEDYYNSLFENKEFFHKDVKIDHEKHQLVHKHFIKKS